MKKLIDSGATIDADNKNGETALIWATINGHLATVQLLIELRANVDYDDRNGDTSLIWAATKGNFE